MRQNLLLPTVLTESQKKLMNKQTGPNKNIISVEEREQQVREGVPVGHRKNLEQLIQEYRDLFPAQLPKGIPPSREVQHQIDVEPGSKPPYRCSALGFLGTVFHVNLISVKCKGQ